MKLETVAGFVLTFGIFSHFEQSRSEPRALCASRIDGVRQALVEFNGAASAYVAASWEAFIELYRWRMNSQRSLFTRFEKHTLLSTLLYVTLSRHVQLDPGGA
jgi:hypothetical protein